MADFLLPLAVRIVLIQSQVQADPENLLPKSKSIVDLLHFGHNDLTHPNKNRHCKQMLAVNVDIVIESTLRLCSVTERK